MYIMSGHRMIRLLMSIKIGKLPMLENMMSILKDQLILWSCEAFIASHLCTNYAISILSLMMMASISIKTALQAR